MAIFIPGLYRPVHPFGADRLDKRLPFKESQEALQSTGGMIKSPGAIAP